MIILYRQLNMIPSRRVQTLYQVTKEETPLSHRAGLLVSSVDPSGSNNQGFDIEDNGTDLNRSPHHAPKDRIQPSETTAIERFAFIALATGRIVSQI